MSAAIYRMPPRAENEWLPASRLIIQDLVTDSPVERSIEKLRGFIADHHGEISSIDAQHVRIKFGGEGSFFRRQGERQIRLHDGFALRRGAGLAHRRTPHRPGADQGSRRNQSASKDATAGIAMRWPEPGNC